MPHMFFLSFEDACKVKPCLDWIGWQRGRAVYVLFFTAGDIIIFPCVFFWLWNEDSYDCTIHTAKIFQIYAWAAAPVFFIHFFYSCLQAALECTPFQFPHMYFTLICSVHVACMSLDCSLISAQMFIRRLRGTHLHACMYLFAFKGVPSQPKYLNHFDYSAILL